MRAAVDHYAKLGAEIVEVSLPHTEYAVAVYYIIATAEASANLARFDGVRYGHRAKDTSGLLELYGKTREEGFGVGGQAAHHPRDVRAQLRVSRRVLPARAEGPHADPAAISSGRLKKWTRSFARPRRCRRSRSGERTQDPLAMYLADIFTIAANLGGVCGVSLPCGFAQGENTGGNALPIGLQLLGPSFDEARLLKSRTPTSKAPTGTCAARRSLRGRAASPRQP